MHFSDDFQFILFRRVDANARTSEMRRLVDYDESGIGDALEVEFGPHLPEVKCTLRDWYFVVSHPTIDVTLMGRRT